MALEQNYWLTTADLPTGTRDALPEKVEVAIVGAGFTGLSAALALAKRGASVALLEAEHIGWGASSRNGGMVLRGLKLPVPTLIRRYGRRLAQEMYAASLASIDLVERIVREEAIDCNFVRCGHLEVACKQAHFTAYAESAERIRREFGRSLRIVSKSELRDEIGSEIYFGGLVDETSAGLNPARYVTGLARVAQRAGACIYERTRVQRVREIKQNGARHFELATARGSLRCRDVLLASGAYTTAATPALRHHVIPIGSYIIATEPLAGSLARELSPRNRMIYDSKHFLHYYRLTPDNRLLFGGRAAFFPESVQTVAKSAEILRGGMVRVFPQLRDIEVAYAWGGTLDFTLDVMPHSGKIAGMHFALGYAGHGVAAATGLGTQIAAIISGESVEIPFSQIPLPHAPIGLRSGNTWALPLAGAYYKVLDWLT